MGRDRGGRRYLTIVREIRNTIHDAALSIEGTVTGIGEHVYQPLVPLRVREHERVLDAMDKLGGRDEWGVTVRFRERGPQLHPGTFVEHLSLGSCHWPTTSCLH